MSAQGKELPFRAAIADAIGCNAPGQHPPCESEVDDVLAVCERYYGQLPEQPEDASSDYCRCNRDTGFCEAAALYARVWNSAHPKDPIWKVGTDGHREGVAMMKILELERVQQSEDAPSGVTGDISELLFIQAAANVMKYRNLDTNTLRAFCAEIGVEILTKPRPTVQALRPVTDEMVERAMVAWETEQHGGEENAKRYVQALRDSGNYEALAVPMRRALEAIIS